MSENTQPNKEEILSEINSLKKEVNSISSKIDIILDILHSFTIMLEEDEDELEESYDSDETWLPDEDDDFWKNN
jgi:hypothetical protein